jgi:hypothetical protein
MLDFLKHCFTGADNTTYDIGRVLWAVAFVIGLAMHVYMTLIGKPYDLQAYGLGIGAILLAGGAAIKMKESSEPKV